MSESEACGLAEGQTVYRYRPGSNLLDRIGVVRPPRPDVPGRVQIGTQQTDWHAGQFDECAHTPAEAVRLQVAKLSIRVGEMERLAEMLEEAADAAGVVAARNLGAK